MPRKRFVPSRSRVLPEAPFATAEAAWFWFMLTQKLRWEGAELDDRPAGHSRPCEPDDIYRAVKHLAREGDLGRRHLRALHRFGVLDRPPDPRCSDEAMDCRHWDEALERLAALLKEKGIVE
jgi:hypothetical protein